MSIKNYRVYISSGIFILLTALKLLFPAHSAALRERVLEAVGRDEDYIQAVAAMGKKLSQGDIGQELISVLGIGTAMKNERSEQMKNESDGQDRFSPMVMDAAQTSAPLQSPEQDDAAEPEQETAPAAEELPETVSAFLQLQAEYEGYEIPENVRVDMPQLPFDYISPVDGEDSSGFGYRLHPIQGEIKFHYGTDFAADTGDEVLAFADGYVYAAGANDSYGNYLILTHEDGFSTIYAHLSQFVAREGDMVSCGQLIGRVGQTGNATGPHLHFEMLVDDIYINPEYYI